MGSLFSSWMNFGSRIGLLKKRSIPGWIAFFFLPVWTLLGHASTAAWFLSFFQSSRQKKPGAVFMPHEARLSLVLFVAGVLWLTVVVLLAEIKSRGPNISAKYLRKHLLPRDPWTGLIAHMFESSGLGMQPVEHDLVVKVYLVNLSKKSTTIQKIVAWAELDGTWQQLKSGDLSAYCLKKEREEGSSGFKDVKNIYAPLDDLWGKIKGVELRQNIGFDGWLAFRMDADTLTMTREKTKTNFRVSIVDSTDKEHLVIGSDLEDESQEGQLTQRPQ